MLILLLWNEFLYIFIHSQSEFLKMCAILLFLHEKIKLNAIFNKYFESTIFVDVTASFMQNMML